MSVINQMLKELDQRNTGNHVGANAQSGNSLPASYAIPEATNHFKKIVATVVIILILVAVYYFKFTDRSTIYEAEQQAAEQVETAIKESAQQVVTKPSNIQPVEQKIIFEQAIVVEKNAVGKNIEDAVTDDVLIEEKIVEENAIEITDNKIVKEVSNQNDVQARVVKSQRQPDLKTQAERLYKSARKKLNANKISDASALLEQAILIKPDFHNARILLYSILFKRQQFDYLSRQVETSLQLWPEVYQYRLMKARLLLQQDSKTEALDLLKNDIPSVTSAPEFHALLAYVAQQTQNDQLAKKHYQLLLQQQSNRADWWLGLAVSEEKLGNKESALQAYVNAIERQGLSQSVLEYARQRIKVLQGF